MKRCLKFLIACIAVVLLCAAAPVQGVHVGGLFVEVRHLVITALLLLVHSVWLILTPLIAYKKFRHLWLLEGLALGFFCGPFGTLIEWLLMPDLSNGRERPLTDIFTGH